MGNDSANAQALAATEAALQDAIRQQADIEHHYQQAIVEMVHNLKNPLGAIIGYVSLMESQLADVPGNKNYKGYIESMDSAASNLLDLCQYLLDQYGPLENRPASPKNSADTREA